MTHSVGNPQPTTPITPAAGAPAPTGMPDSTTTARPQPASVGRALAPIAVIGVITAGTASWQLLGPWPTVGGACGLLIIAGGVARWRSGARPALSSTPTGGWRWARGARPARSSARTRATPAAPRPRAGRASPAALARPRPRRSAPHPLAQPRTRARQEPAKRKRQRSRAGWRWRAPEWGWARGAAAILITPVALLLSGATHFVAALRPILARPEPAIGDVEETQEEAQPAPGRATPAPAVARPGPPVARPTPRPASSSSPRSTTMSPSSSPTTYATADAIRDYIGGFTPQNAADLTGFVCGLHEVFAALQESLGGVNTRFSDDEPVDHRVVEHLNELRGMLVPIVDFAEEAGPLFHAAHEADLKRIEDPRPNEQKMDYSQQ